MTLIKFEKLQLNGAFLIRNFAVGDHRGGFTKCFEKEVFRGAGIEFNLNETFVSVSSKNVIRGLHFQKHKPQAKIVCVLQGKVQDVIVDLRPNSVTYKRWVSVDLSAENHCGVFIPRGFAHGFAALEDNTIMLYQCDGAYDPNTDSGIRFNDPELGIDWFVDENVAIHSKRDLELESVEEYEKMPMDGYDKYTRN